MKAIQMTRHGGPEVLDLKDLSRPDPGPGEVLVNVEAVGVNFIDIYRREGAYKVALPHVPGTEAAGTVAAVGEGVSTLRPGDRVAGAAFVGAYAEVAVAPAAQLVRVPDGVSSEQAAAVMLQGMTAHYLAHSTYALKEGDTCLVHAAAGGVGLLLIQLAKRAGARVIGTVSTADKEALARAAGADEIVRYTETDFVSVVAELTGGEGVEVVYDSVGKTTFAGSLDCLKPRGLLALFGQSSGAVPPFDLQVLNAKGSLFVTRPSLGHYTRTPDELAWRAGEVLEGVASGALSVRIDSSLPLAEAAEAHRRLGSRETSGKVLLLP
jgi:NADPH:quinone reductase